MGQWRGGLAHTGGTCARVSGDNAPFSDNICVGYDTIDEEPAPTSSNDTARNVLYTANGEAKINNYKSLAAAQAAGLEPGSSARKISSLGVEGVLAAVRSLLDF